MMTEDCRSAYRRVASKALHGPIGETDDIWFFHPNEEPTEIDLKDELAFLMCVGQSTRR